MCPCNCTDVSDCLADTPTASGVQPALRTPDILPRQHPLPTPDSAPARSRKSPQTSLLVRARPQLWERDPSTNVSQFAKLDEDELEEVGPSCHLLGKRGADEFRGLDGGDEV